MAVMELVALPTEEDIALNVIERETFFDAFDNARIGGLQARVEDCGDHVLLDGYSIQKAKWFVVVAG
ncbi:hypothetical protein QU487_06480 [Crenobacter sp. SG2305]|uniref:hypothetical protein n=1 Tax=Crenobacter oryzisoli TaxID=3056844 RepID=UPI0025AABA73|nr:hypothetical protein [Crenobacter sp. SG2305]MDN0082399.1 hypothetical protein [Crenobacter sp. SG2305]